MKIRGPVATLLAVAAAGAAVITTNVVLTAQPAPVDQSAAALSADATGYGSGAAAPAAAAPSRYDGRSAGGEVTVQVTVDNGQAKALVCNGGKGIQYWMNGPVQDGRMQLTGADGSSLDATSDGTAVLGTARAKGKSWPFSAAVATESPAGAAAPAAPAAPAPAPAAPVSQDTGGGGYY